MEWVRVSASLIPWEAGKGVPMHPGGAQVSRNRMHSEPPPTTLRPNRGKNLVLLMSAGCPVVAAVVYVKRAYCTAMKANPQYYTERLPRGRAGKSLPSVTMVCVRRVSVCKGWCWNAASLFGVHGFVFDPNPKAATQVLYMNHQFCSQLARESCPSPPGTSASLYTREQGRT